VVTARSGTTLTVTRGQEGTTAAAWASGAFISFVVTADAILNLRVQTVIYSGSLSTTRPPASVVIWEGFPSQPTNMVTGDLWLDTSGGAFLTGTAAPTGTDGNDGDMYLRTSTSMLYGPKAAGSWPAGVSLIGPAGVVSATAPATYNSGTGVIGVTLGTSSTSAAAGNDSRLSNARTPTAHASTHASAGSDPVTLDASQVTGLGTAAAANTGTTSGTIPLLSTGGVLPIARLATGTPSGSKFVRDDGTLAAPAGGWSMDYTLPTGGLAATFDRTAVSATSSQTLTSGSLYLAAIVLKAGVTYSALNVRAVTGWTSVTHSWAGIYDSSEVVLAISADDTTATVSATTTKTWTLGSAYTPSITGFFYVGIMAVGTGISVLGKSLGSAQISTLAPITLGVADSGLTTPQSVGATASAITPGVVHPYVWLT
jgi:hypothetical protein